MEHLNKTYLMRDKTTNYIKIGKSKNVFYREKTLQAEKPTIEGLFYVEDDIEKLLHSLFAEKRLRGEWFNLNQEDIDLIDQIITRKGLIKKEFSLHNVTISKKSNNKPEISERQGNGILDYESIEDIANTRIAKIDIGFIRHAQYKLTAKEQKIVYYLISYFDPKSEKEFYTVSLKEIEKMLRDNDDKYGSFYEEMERICKSLSVKQISFPARFTNRGSPILGYINWFQSIIPIQTKDGNIIRFAFSVDMSPFLLQLHQYVNINPLEVVPMTNAHAIRMYPVFKSEKDRMRGIKDVVTMTYVLEELKELLGIPDKYKSGDLKEFRDYVLNKIRDDINKNSPSLSVEYTYLKRQRKVTGVAFNVSDKQQAAKQLQAPQPPKEVKPKTDIKTYTPSDKEIAVLSPAKLKAYNILLNYGIFAGIAYKQILPKIKGSEFEGYEDFFIERAIQHFEKTAIQTTTKDLKASTFVTWWTKNKVFESGDVWVDILEKLGRYKKQSLNNTAEKPKKRVGEQTISSVLSPMKPDYGQAAYAPIENSREVLSPITSSYQPPEMFNIEQFQEQHPELYAQFLAKAAAGFEKVYAEANRPFVRLKWEKQIVEHAQEWAKEWTKGNIS